MNLGRLRLCDANNAVSIVDITKPLKSKKSKMHTVQKPLQEAGAASANSQKSFSGKHLSMSSEAE